MTNHPYFFPQKKTFITALNHYLTHEPIPCFIVNHYTHIYFIAEIAKKTSFIIQNTQKNNTSFYLLSPTNAVTYLGARWWLSFIKKTAPIIHQYNVINILDCNDNTGLALSALRLGQKHILFDSKISQYQAIDHRAQTLGSKIYINKPNAFNLLNLNFKKSLFSK